MRTGRGFGAPLGGGLGPAIPSALYRPARKLTKPQQRRQAQGERAQADGQAEALKAAGAAALDVWDPRPAVLRARDIERTGGELSGRIEDLDARKRQFKMRANKFNRANRKNPRRTVDYGKI